MLLCLCLSVCLFTLHALATEGETCGENVTWTFDGETLTISGNGPMSDYSLENPAPWSDLGPVYTLEITSGVTKIGDYAFYEMKHLFDVTLPDTLTTVGSYAFYNCFSIQQLQFFEGLTTIEEYAFNGLSSITSLTLPESVQSIGTYAFCGCSNMKTLDLGAGDITFGSYAFAASGVVNPVIPEGVTVLPNYLFWNCRNIGSVYLPTSITNISYAFYNSALRTAYYAGDEDSWSQVVGNDIESSYSTVKVYYNGRTTADTALGDSGLTYHISNDVLTISGTGAMPNYTSSSEQPWYYNRNSITKVVLDTGVTSVGDNAFAYLSALKEVEFSERITTIGEDAFYECSKLERVNLPERLTTIGEGAFSNCNLEELVIPDRVTTIGSYAFSSADRLRYVKIPNRVTSLGRNAFASCTGLETVVIPANLKTIPDYAFYSCNALQQVYYTGTEAQWGSVTIGTYNTALTTAQISYNWRQAVSSGTCGDTLNWEIDSNGLLQITGSGAMPNYTEEDPAPWKDLAVTAVIVEGADNIGASAFLDCTALVNVRLSSSVTTIGENAFAGCTALTGLTFAGSQNQWDAMAIGLGNEALYGESLSLTLLDNVIASTSKWKLYADGTLHMLANSSDWRDWETYIRYIVMDSGVTSAPDMRNMPNLERVEMSDNIRSSYSYYLQNCPKLTCVKLSANMTSIPSFYFSGCTALESIVISDNVTSLGNNLFDGCTALRSVILSSNLITIDSSAFRNCSSLESITLPDTLTTIGSYVFTGCTSLKSVVLPYSVTSVGDYTFSGCAALETVTLSDGMESIGIALFRNCTSLKVVLIPDSISSIGINAFENCHSLVEVEIPDSITSIGNYAFANCIGLRQVVIPNSVTTMGSYAFSGCGRLQTVQIPDSLRTIGNYAFQNCISISTLEIPDSITTIGEYAFYNLSLLEELEIPDSVTSIGAYAFAHCDKLTDLTIPGSVQTIGNYAFQHSGLQSVMIYRGLTTLGYNIFSYCDDIKGIFYEGTQTQWEAISGYNTLSSYTKYYQSIYKDGAVSGSCGAAAKWQYLPQTSQLIISGRGACANYTSSARAPWYYFDITEVIVQSGVTSVGDYSFYQDTSVTSVTLADTVTGLGNYAFSGCTGLESIEIPASIDTVGNYAFSGCTGVETLTIGEGVTQIGMYAFSGTQITSVDMPDSVTTLGTYAFNNCTSLTDAKLSNALTAVPAGTFYGCSNLRHVTLGENITNIGNYVFTATYFLSDVYFNGTSEQWSRITINTNPYLTTAVVCCLGDIVASGTCTDTLTWEISTDGCLTILGDGPIPDYAAFEDTPWSDYAGQITSVKLGRFVTGIGSHALGGLGGQVQLEYWGTQEQWDAVTVSAGNGNLAENIVFGEAAILKSGTIGTSSTFTWKLSVDGVLTVSGTGSMPGIGYANVYVNNTYWAILDSPWRCVNTKIRHIEVEEGITALGSNAFSGTDARTVSLPSTLKSLANSCFRYCDHLTKISIPYGVTRIDTYAFYQCVSLEEVVLPESINYIGERCFGDCSSLKTIKLPSNVKSLSSYAFDGCTALEYLRLPEGMTTIYSQVFCDNSALQRIYIPATVNSVAVDAFKNCTALTDIYFQGTEETWNAWGLDTLNAKVHFESTVEVGCNQTLLSCPLCGDVSMDGEAVITHIWDDGTVTTQPDCVTEGEKTFTCAHNCSVIRKESVAALGHTEVTDPAKKETCTEVGLTEGRHCSVCEEVLIAQETIAKLGHNLSQWETETEPTCTLEGLQRRVCSRCEYEETQAIAAKDHNYISSVTGPTCTEQGYTTDTCQDCGFAVYRNYVDPLGHSEVTDAAVEPDCTATGLTEGVHCSVCGEVLIVQEVVPALGHELGDWVTIQAAECTEEGQQRRDCFRCDYHETEAIAATGHSYVPQVKLPTCTEPGYTIMLCHCGDSRMTDYVHTVPHVEETVEEVGATCTEFGTTAGIRCSVCHSTLSGIEPIEPLGHELEYGICIRCDEVLQIILQIVAQPQSIDVAEGETAAVFVEAVGEDLSYTWYYKDVHSDTFARSRACVTNTYQVTMNDIRNGREVYCVITDAYGNTVTTDTVTLTMTTSVRKPVVVKQPESVEIIKGEIARVTLEAAGDDLTYQWYYRNAGDEAFTITTAFDGNYYQVIMNDARDGREVYCVITDIYGNSITTQIVTLTMAVSIQELEILRQPESVEATKGEIARVTLEAVGDDLTYQWYYRNAGDEDFVRTNAFDGNSYQVIMNDARNGREVYCVITDAYGNSVTTQAVMLTMTQADIQLIITVQPQSVEVAVGENVEISLEALGEDLSYTWYYKDAADTQFHRSYAYTGNCYSTTMTENRDGRQVYCVITDAYGNSVTSNTVTLTMALEYVKITQQPVSVTVGAGKKATVTVVAEGEGLSYAWYYKDVGATQFSLTTSFTGDSYSITMTRARAGRQVYCVITDQYGNFVITDTVTLGMEETPLKITQQPVSVQVAPGEKARVSVKAEGVDLTYQWYFRNAGMDEFLLTTSFTGNYYSIDMNASRAGRQVYCVITDAYGNSLTTDVVTLDMDSQALKITQQPISVTVAAGERARVTVIAVGDGLTYQWYYKDPGDDEFRLTTSFTSNYYSITMTGSRSGRQVYCVITDDKGNSVTSNTVTLEAESIILKITQQPVSVQVASGENARVTVEAEGIGLTYQWYFKNAGMDEFLLTTSFTGNYYSIDMNASRAGRQVYCVITDSEGNSVTTDIVTLYMA